MKASILGSIRSEHLTFLDSAELFNYGSVTKVRLPRDFIIYYQNLNLLVLCTTPVSKHATFILRTAQSRNEAHTLSTKSWLAPVGTVGVVSWSQCETQMQDPHPSPIVKRASLGHAIVPHCPPPTTSKPPEF